MAPLLSPQPATLDTLPLTDNWQLLSFPLLRTVVLATRPPHDPQSSPHRRISWLVTLIPPANANSQLPCNMAQSQVPGIRTQTSLGDRYPAYHTREHQRHQVCISRPHSGLPGGVLTKIRNWGFEELIRFSKDILLVRDRAGTRPHLSSCVFCLFVCFLIKTLTFSGDDLLSFLFFCLSRKFIFLQLWIIAS